MFANQLADQVLDRFFLTNIAGGPIRLATVFGNLGGDAFQLVGLAPDQQHVRAEGRQFMRGTPADAAAAAGDNDGLARKQIGFENRIVSHGDSPLVDLVGDALRHRNLDLQQLLGEGFALRIDPQAGHATAAEGVFQ